MVAASFSRKKIIIQTPFLSKMKKSYFSRLTHDQTIGYD